MTSIIPRLPALCFTAAATALSLLSVALPAQAFGGGAGFDFAAMDADKNGQITQAELDSFRAARAADLDADKDGFISAGEMSAPMMERLQERIEKMARHAIVEQDADGDGKVSLAEMGTGRDLDKLMARADANGDGALSQEELAAKRTQMQERAGGKEGRHGGREQGHGCGMGGPLWPFGGEAATE